MSRTALRWWMIPIGLLLLVPTEAKKLELLVDYASLRANDSSAFWELMFAIPDTCFSYRTVRDGYQGEMLLQVIIQQDGEEVINDASRIVAFSDVPVRTFRRTISGWKHYQLRVGRAIVTLKLYSLPDRTDSLISTFTVNVRSYPAERLQLSELLFLKEIRRAKSGDNPRFVINGLYMVPNPARLLVSTTPHLRLYGEVYHIQRFAPQGYQVIYRIYDVVRRIQAEVRQQREAIANAQVIYLDLPIPDLPSGIYTVGVTVKPVGGEDSVTQWKKFFLWNPQKPPVAQEVLAEIADFQKSPFATMTRQQVDKEFEQLKPLLPEQQIALYEALDSLEARQKYLFRFWLLQDPDPATAVNEAREDFLKRVAYANKHFASPQYAEGWRSDRGRVLRLYGFPDEIDRYPMTGSAPAYQIWRYHGLEGGVIFVFVDFQGNNVYRLVHSTKQGELYDPYWEQKYLRPGRTGADYETKKGVFDRREFLPGNPQMPR